MVNYEWNIKIQAKEKKMKKYLLILISTVSLVFSSAITVFAEDFSQSEKTGFSNIIEKFFESPAAIISAVFFIVATVLIAVFGRKIADRLDNTTAKSMTNIFILFFSVFGIASLIMGFMSEGETWSNLMHKNPDATFPFTQFEDYIQNVKYAGRKDFYKMAGNNTPFSILMFYLLAQFLPPKLLFSDSFTYGIIILRNQTFMYMYLILVMMIVFLTYKMNRYVLRRNGLNFRDEIISFLLVVSFPAIYCIEKGNFSAISLMLSLLFILFRNSEKKAFRELSYLSLAVSAAITPYTLIYAFLLVDVKDKKSFINFAKTVGYFVILFITPAFFTGFGNLLTYVKVFLNVDADAYIRTNMSIANILHFFGISNTAIVYAVFILTEAIALLAMFVLPSVWQKSVAATYIMLNIFSVSDPVVAIFAFIPLIFILAEKSHSKYDWFYMFALAFLVTPLPEWFRYDSIAFDEFLATMNITVNNANELIAPAATQFIVILLLVQIVSFFKTRKTKATVTAAPSDTGSV